MFPHQLYRKAQVLQAKHVIEFTATSLVCLVAWNAVNQTNKIHAAFLQGSGGFLQSVCMLFLYVCGSTCLCSGCRGQSGHSVTTDGQEKPGGHLKGPGQCSLHTVYVCVFQFLACVCATAAQLTEAVQPPLSCNKCHPCLLQLHSKSSDQSHTNTHTVHTNIHMQTFRHALFHAHTARRQKQISLQPERAVQHHLN